VEITEIGPEELHLFAAVPIRFRVESVLRVEEVDGGLGGLRLVEEPVARPYVKDYDAELPQERPTRWPRRYDLSYWRFVLARESGESIGAAAVACGAQELDLMAGGEELAVLWDLRVHPDHRRRGVGAGLFERVLQCAREEGCTRLAIETQNVNVAASRFYASRGCRLAAIRQHAYVEPMSHETMLVWYVDL
jgi:GNAT superfamily N-acetyltransferase